MNHSNFKFTLDLQSTQSQVCIPVTRGDTARTWLINFRDGSKTYMITDGCLAKLEILRPTGTRLEEFCAIEKNEAVRYSFTQNKNTAAVEGFHECAVVLYDEDGNVIGSPRFCMIVSGRVINTDDINLSDEDQLIIDSIIPEEAYRKIAEAQRTQNEIARQTAESERAIAEESRTERFEALQKEVSDAAATLVSPTVNVTPTENGHQVMVTDSKGEHTFSLENGGQGPQGVPGKSAYAYAKENGYAGTEENYADDMNPDRIKTEANAYIAQELAKKGQLKPEFANSIEECTDTSKLYVLPDGYIYAYMLVTHAGGEPLFTNQLPRAIDKDGSIYNGKGFKEGTGIASSDGGETSNGSVAVTGFIKAKKDDVIRVKGFTIGDNANIVLGYDENFSKYGTSEWPELWADAVDGVYTFNAPGYSNTIYIRIAVKTISDDAIVTVNEEIKYGEPTSHYQWASTGRQFVPADYDDRIFSLEADSKDHLRRITVIEKVIESGDLQNKTDEEKINGFRYWDRAIYDKIPTYTLSDEAKEAVSDSMKTNTAIYQKYDELMALANREWQYVTKTLLGQDEAGFDVYRYDFKMPDIPTVVASTTSKAVPKVILISGVHPEWAGIYALYNTMYEITTNPDLIDLKRNVHFIVVPIVNAYSCNTGNRKNINGIDIARNFEVDFIKQTETTLSTYGGTEPLSELEAYYVDKIMNENQDALFFASCHNFFNDEPYNRCMWGAAATKYFSNVCQKLIDKLTRAWSSKYSYIPKSTYLGHTGISAPNGSEGRQALKYGIQGGTLECRCNFPYHSETPYTSFSQSRATEIYVNFLLTALGNFEACDKRISDF